MHATNIVLFPFEYALALTSFCSDFKITIIALSKTSLLHAKKKIVATRNLPFACEKG